MAYSGKIIDIHAHVQPAPVLKDRRRFVETEPDFRILYEDPSSALSSVSDLSESMWRTGVDSAVMLGFAWRDEKTLAGHNDLILNSAAGSGGKLFAFPCVYPFSADSAGEAGRCFARGAHGIGEVGLYSRDVDAEYIDAMKPVMKVCLEHDRPLMLHVNEPIGHDYSGKAPNSISGIYNFVKAFPDNRIILAHWGGGLFFYSSLKKEVGPMLKNVWFDSSASPYLYDERIWKLAVELAGPERILLGTDFPLLEADRYLKELERSGLSDDVLERILYKNAAELLRI